MNNELRKHRRTFKNFTDAVEYSMQIEMEKPIMELRHQARCNRVMRGDACNCDQKYIVCCLK